MAHAGAGGTFSRPIGDRRRQTYAGSSRCSGEPLLSHCNHWRFPDAVLQGTMGFPTGYQSGCSEMRANHLRRPLRFRRCRPRYDASSGRRAAPACHGRRQPSLVPEGYGCVSTSATIAGRASNAGIAAKIRCAKKRKAPALGRRLVMPVDDLGTPSPREGSTCCEKETDRFSICYGHDVSVRRKESNGEQLACRSYLASTSAQPRSGSR